MKVSILVPVYGVEKYIEQCATTLFEQTYRDIEYIFVDDCTPDNSIGILQQVLKRYADRKEQVSIISHEQNRGLGVARKTALDAATGEYVLNVDSDDYLETDAVEKLVNAQQQTKAEIVTSAFYYVYGDCRTIYHHIPELSKTEMLRMMLIQNTVLPHIWARLIKKEVYTAHHISPVEGINMAEDYAITPKLLMAAGKTAFISDATYYYRVISASSTFSSQYTRKHAESYLRANNEVLQFFHTHDKEQKYLFSLEIGMLNATHYALMSGLTLDEMYTLCHYHPQGCIFRLCRLLFAHQSTKALLRFAYLVIKWFYKKKHGYRPLQPRH